MFDGQPVIPIYDIRKADLISAYHLQTSNNAQTHSIVGNRFSAYNPLSIIKIFDGLFLGNHISCKQPEFISNNKVTLIINCSPKDINVGAHLRCIAFDWFGRGGEIVQKISLKQMIDIVERIDKVKERCQSALIIADHAQSKSLAMCVAYLMLKYQWELYQTLQFINSKKSNLQLKASYLKLLLEFEGTIKKEKSKGRDGGKSQQLIQQELMLKNTFINSQVKNMPNFNGFDFKIDDSPPNFNIPSPPENNLNPFYQQNTIVVVQPNTSKPAKKKVKFDHKSTEIIDFDQEKAFIPHKKPPQSEGAQKFKQIKIRTIQNKLKQFIMDKFNNIGPQKHKHKIRTKQVEQGNIIQKSRKISCKTQQSQIHDPISDFTNNLAKFKKDNYINEHSYTQMSDTTYSNFIPYTHLSELSNKKQSSQSINFSIPLQSAANQKELRMKALSTYAPRRKFKQKCITQHNTEAIQENMTQKANNKYFINEEIKKNKLGSNSAFKISTKSINQNYKVKRSFSPYPPELPQKKITSQKCIALSLPSQDQPFSFPDDSPIKSNIFNVNVNVKIGQVKVVQKKNMSATKKSGVLQQRFKVYMGESNKTKYANSQRKKPL